MMNRLDGLATDNIPAIMHWSPLGSVADDWPELSGPVKQPQPILTHCCIIARFVFFPPLVPRCSMFDESEWDAHVLAPHY